MITYSNRTTCRFCKKHFKIKKTFLTTYGNNKRGQFCSRKCYIDAQKFSRDYLYPSFNKKSITFFKKINKTFLLNGRFAKNGGEKLIIIDGKRFWLDYYDHNKNIVIEWDEERHYKKNKLKKEDAKRQSIIEKHLDCKIYRIRERYFNEKKEIEKIRDFIYG